MSVLSSARREFHAALLRDLMRVNPSGVPNFADASSRSSTTLARAIVEHLEGEVGLGVICAQTSGALFEDLVMNFIREVFTNLGHLRPGTWNFARNSAIAAFEQYAHLRTLTQAVKSDWQLAAALGSDYVIKPDIVITRTPETDAYINEATEIVDASAGLHAPVRGANQPMELLHASISCKWTIRSDRSQNSRTEALNLIRNRKGRVPHIVVVTAEPMPGRIASIALGTGDVDCTYHIALNELLESAQKVGSEDALDLLQTMIEGKRLRDISDLPLDLTV